MPDHQSFDVICIGGGAIGLLTAHDLALAGRRVAVFDRGPMGKEASWAGAGIIPPAFLDDAVTPYDRLRSTSFERFPQLAEELVEETGIDIGFRPTGALEIARTPADVDELARARASRLATGIKSETLETAQLLLREPGLRAQQADWLPQMAQLRNPRYLQGLIARCRQLGVALFEHAPVTELNVDNDRITSLCTDRDESFVASDIVVSAGAWSGSLLSRFFPHQLPLHPVQGQIIVFDTPGGDVRHIILEGKRYLVPREDGLVLIGATEEDVAFDKQVTEEALAELRSFAIELFPSLANRCVKYWWAGLRPGNRLGHPIIGRIGGMSNLWAATGHFRHGLQQSPGTARLLCDWITGKSSFAVESDFAVDTPSDTFQSAFQS